MIDEDDMPTSNASTIYTFAYYLNAELYIWALLIKQAK